MEEIKELGVDWKKEYEKLVLTRKYAEACTLVGKLFTAPSETLFRLALGAVVDYVLSIPTTSNDVYHEKKQDLLKRLDELESVFTTNPLSESFEQIKKKYEIEIIPVRQSGRIVYKISNIVPLAVELREILNEAGTLATEAGLRITISPKRKYGMQRILELEGFEDLKIKGE